MVDCEYPPGVLPGVAVAGHRSEWNRETHGAKSRARNSGADPRGRRHLVSQLHHQHDLRRRRSGSSLTAADISPPPIRRALAIVNPATGRHDPRRLQAILASVAAARGVTLDVLFTAAPGGAVALAREASTKFDVLIAVGGDGTVSDVITGAIDTDALFGIIPAGTTNMVAKDLGIPRDPRRASAIALGEGVARRIDVARAGQSTFVHLAGAGYDAEIMRRTPAHWKRRVGWLAYMPAALRLIRYPMFPLTVDLDGRCASGHARLVLCAVGASIIHPRLTIGAGIDRSDGLLDVCIFDPRSLPATLSTIAWFALGRPARSRWQHQARGRRVRLSSDADVAFEIDGDWMGSLPVEIEMLDRQARVLVPR